MMRRHLQDYAFKSRLRRDDGAPPKVATPWESRANALTGAYLTNLRTNASAAAVAHTSVPVKNDIALKIPPLRIPNGNRVAAGSLSARVPSAAHVAAAPQPSAATSRAHGGGGMWDHHSLTNSLARLTAEASQSTRILGSLHDKIAATKPQRPRLPLFSSPRASAKKDRRPLWVMAASIPKLFASLVVNRGDTGFAAVDARLKSEQAGSGGAEEGGSIGLEHWMEFCRETDAFSKLHVAPSDCIFAFRRGVEAAGSDESALARKVGLVMNLEAFCGCVVVLAELAGALPNDPNRPARDGALHAVWDCDADTSRACSLLLLKLLTAAPGAPPPKAASFVPHPPQEAATTTPLSAAPASKAAAGIPARAHSFPRAPPPLPPMSASPCKSSRRLSSPDVEAYRYSGLVPHPPPPRSSVPTDYPESSATSSPSKSFQKSFKSSALTASPPTTFRHGRRGRKQPDAFPRSQSHHIVDIATGSEFLRWFQDKLTQIGSDGLAYPVRIVAVQVPFNWFSLPHPSRPLNPSRPLPLQLDRAARPKKSREVPIVPIGLDGKPLVDISLGNQNMVDKYFRQQLRGRS